MTINSCIGDYKTSFQQLLNNVEALKIDIVGYPLSHLGYRTDTDAEYQQIKTALLPHCHSYIENQHNGRLISKLQLRESLKLPADFKVSLIELMPPKPNRSYTSGIEHWGIVLGSDFESFKQAHQEITTGQQDQGPFCQPLFIRFMDGTRAKFYDISLKDVVIKEGKRFVEL